jgi:hypothetical protein
MTGLKRGRAPLRCEGRHAGRQTHGNGHEYVHRVLGGSGGFGTYRPNDATEENARHTLLFTRIATLTTTG